MVQHLFHYGVIMRRLNSQACLEIQRHRTTINSIYVALKLNPVRELFRSGTDKVVYCATGIRQVKVVELLMLGCLSSDNCYHQYRGFINNASAFFN